MCRRILLVALSAVLLSACGPIDTLRDGFAHSQQVATQLEQKLGLKAMVGFNWSNGSLTTVTVTFQGVPQQANLGEISTAIERTVIAEFKQTPKQIVVSFVIEP